mmetsp:Transcript_11251/g.12896  ORF Transcript_11251/g.12896 Transcript_11251/m.12896 type:complete len:411 (+) Transcript_11251:79-1311(+)
MALENGYSSGLQSIQLEDNNTRGSEVPKRKDSLVFEGQEEITQKKKWYLKVAQRLPYVLLWLVFGLIVGAAMGQQKRRSDEHDEVACDENMDGVFELNTCFSHSEESPTLAAEVQNATLNFLVVGDWGRNGHCCQRDVAYEMGKVSKELETDFTISTGDNFYSSGIWSKDDPQVDASWAKVYNYFDLLDKPWYNIVGNHDYKGDPNVQLDIGQVYKSWTMDNFSYTKSFEHENRVLLDIVFIDTSPLIESYYNMSEMNMQDNKLEDARTAVKSFLTEALSQSTATWKVVVGHHPVFTVGEHYGEDDFLEDQVASILESNNVAAYFCGHDHNLQHLSRNGVEYFVSGAGSKIRLRAENRYVEDEEDSHAPFPHFHSGKQGFASVSLSEEEMLIQFIDLRGVWLYSKTIQKP